MTGNRVQGEMKGRLQISQRKAERRGELADERATALPLIAHLIRELRVPSGLSALEGLQSHLKVFIIQVCFS